jgi:hypothetical protein
MRSGCMFNLAFFYFLNGLETGIFIVGTTWVPTMWNMKSKLDIMSFLSEMHIRRHSSEIPIPVYLKRYAL